jgi:hypothetical protein
LAKSTCFMLSTSPHISLSRQYGMGSNYCFVARRTHTLFNRADPTSVLFTLASLAVRSTSGSSVQMSQPSRIIALDAFARRQFKVVSMELSVSSLDSEMLVFSS